MPRINVEKRNENLNPTPACVGFLLSKGTLRYGSVTVDALRAVSSTIF